MLYEYDQRDTLASGDLESSIKQQMIKTHLWQFDATEKIISLIMSIKCIVYDLLELWHCYHLTIKQYMSYIVCINLISSLYSQIYY